MKTNNTALSKPSVRTPGLASIPVPDMHRFSNEVPVYLFPSDKTEIVRLELGYRAGALYETKPLQAQFTSLMLTGGTASMTAQQISEAFDYYGSFPNFATDRDKASAQLYMLPKLFRETASLLKEVIYNPVFHEPELKMHCENRLQKYLINIQRVSFITLNHLFENLFGAIHPYGRRIIPEYYNALTQNDLVEFHKAYFRKGLYRIVISGNITQEVMKATEELFGNEQISSEPDTYPSLMPEETSGRKIFIEKPGAVQNSVRIGRRTISMKHPDYPGLKILDTILGGYFGSRLMSNLREKRGYTYGVGSSLFSLKLSGLEIITTEVGATYTREAVKAIYSEIGRLQRTSVSKRELKLVRNNMLGALVRLFDGPFATTESSMSAIEKGLGMDYYTILEDTIKSISQNKIKQLAETYYNIDGFHEIIAGSKP